MIRHLVAKIKGEKKIKQIIGIIHFNSNKNYVVHLIYLTIVNRLYLTENKFFSNV